MEGTFHRRTAAGVLGRTGRVRARRPEDHPGGRYSRTPPKALNRR